MAYSIVKITGTHSLISTNISNDGLSLSLDTNTYGYIYVMNKTPFKYVFMNASEATKVLTNWGLRDSADVFILPATKEDIINGYFLPNNQRTWRLAGG